MEEDGIQINFQSNIDNNGGSQKKQNEKAEKRKNKYQNKFLKKKGQQNNKNKPKIYFQDQENKQGNQQQIKEEELKNQKQTTDLDEQTLQMLQNQGDMGDSSDDEYFGKKKNTNNNLNNNNQQQNQQNKQQDQKLSRKERKDKYKSQDQQHEKPQKLMDKFTQKLDGQQQQQKKKQKKEPNFDKMDIENEEQKFDENGKPIIYQLEKIKDDIQTEIFTAKKFDEIPNLHKKIQSALTENKFEILTKIQHESYPSIQQGHNVAVKSETGSGKTLAYLVPLLNNLLNQAEKVQRDMGPLMIIIVPTRELAIQCQDVAQKLLHWANNVICGGLLGGENPQKEKARIRKGVNVLFATPGRLLYHLKNTNSFKMAKLQTIIFEESDRTLDMGFKKDLEEIIKLIEEKLDFEEVQKILISAHFSEQIEKLYIKMSKKEIKYVGFSENNPDYQEEENITEYIQIDKNIKVPKRLKQYYTVVSEEARIQFLIAYLHKLQNTKTIVFLSTCSQVEYFELLTQQLMFKNSNGEDTQDQVLDDLEVYKLHGNIEQRERSETYFKFKNTESAAVLYSTDVAARGLDFPEVTHTVLFEVPPTLVDYCNRIGRTARMDKKGVSILVLNKPEEEFANKLQQQGLELSLMESRPIFQGFSRHIKMKYNIGQFGDIYLEGLTKSLLKKDKQKNSLARSAYISSLRAYARLKDRTIFRVKALNLQGVAKSYGLTSVKSKDKETKSDEYQERLEKMHKNKILEDRLTERFSKKMPRQALNVKKTMASEFM